MKLNWKLLLIILFAAYLRLYQLGNVPPSLDWDEVSLAYNAKALLETGKDEYGNSWPITIRSFNDYKPALYTYILIPSIAVFGESNFAIRLPSALLGTLTVLMTYLLVVELFSNKNDSLYTPRKTIALVASLLLTISPWHAHFSRVAFEANIGLSFFIAGMYCFQKARKNPWWLVGSAGAFGLSLMAYHSTKVIIPLLMGIIIWPYLKGFFAAPWALISATIIALLFGGLILRTIQLGVGQARLNTVSIMTIDNLLDNSRHRIEAENYSLTSRIINHRYVAYFKEVAGGYLDHFDPKFWFIEGDSIERLTFVKTMGLLFWWEAIFLIVGLLYLASHPGNNKKVIFAWFLLAPAAASLTSGTPNAIRSIYFLPTFQIFISVGIITVMSWLKQPNIWVRIMALGYVFGAIVNVGVYFHHYYTHASGETSSGWQYGYQPMIEWVMKEKDKYNKVIITTSYDQPYIYTLWYGKYSPRQWQNDGEFAKRFDIFEFRSIKWEEDKNLPNTLLIGTSDEIKGKDHILWSINFLDNSPAFLATKSER